VRDLPHELVAAFRSTLMEARDADLLLHVVDAADADRERRIEQVDELVAGIGAGSIPQLRVYNKIDRLGRAPELVRDAAGQPSAVWLSAASGAGVGLLRDALQEIFGQAAMRLAVVLPPSQGRLRARLYEERLVRAEEPLPDGHTRLVVESSHQRLEALCREAGVDFATAVSPCPAAPGFVEFPRDAASSAPDFPSTRRALLMAWNDPGKNENPWQRKPDKGPPTSTSCFAGCRSACAPVRRPFVAWRQRRKPRAGRELDPRGLADDLVLFGSFYLNGAAERSVITRFGKYVKTTAGGFNMRVPWPIDQRTVINVTEFRSFTDRTRMLTQDEALVDINLAVQYRRADPVKFAFNVRDPEETLGEVSESAIREIIGQSRLDFVLEAGRQEIGAKTKELVQRTIAAYNTGIEVISVNLQDVSVPSRSRPRRRMRSRRVRTRSAPRSPPRRTRTTSCRRRAAPRSARSRARAPTRVRVAADAVGATSRFLAVAAEYQKAPAVTRERLYLETMEQVLGSATKVLVDTEGTGNMIYLPLDKLLDQKGGARGADTPPTIRLDDGTELGADDPRARKER
jgi:membrane protease subunit HflK